MASVFDVAQYIVRERGSMSSMKLQKLCYYSQAWHLVWSDEPMFVEPFQAWANGPVAPALYAKHRGEFSVDENFLFGDADALTDDQEDSMTGYELSVLTHDEDPWVEARGGLPRGVRCATEISHAAMAEYYGSL